MKIKHLLIFVLSLILLSCGGVECDCVFPETIPNSYKVSITPKENFKIDKDTIWINGFVSSKVFDESSSDSIFSENHIQDIFSIFKFVTPTESYNLKDAVANFELIDQTNGIRFFESCENATIIKNSVISSDSLFYTYRLGLIPKVLGDFTISFQNSQILNTDRNVAIVNGYPIANLPDEIGFNSCGNYSWRILKETEKEYYFKVSDN